MDEDGFTAQQASDPSTPGQVLADIAALRPDLRPAVARNPAAYPGLLEWLAALGEPSVDAALRERAASMATGAAGATGATTSSEAAGGREPSGPRFSGPYGQGSPGRPSYGQAAASELAYGQGASAQPSYGHGPQQHGAYPPGTSGAPGQPRPASTTKVLWIVLGVLLGLIGLAVALVFLLAGLFRDAVDAGLSGGTYGSDPALDRLWDRCAEQDWAACDELYLDSPFGSEYESFGETCGDRTQEAFSTCVDRFAESS